MSKILKAPEKTEEQKRRIRAIILSKILKDPEKTEDQKRRIRAIMLKGRQQGCSTYIKYNQRIYSYKFDRNPDRFTKVDLEPIIGKPDNLMIEDIK